MTTREGKAITFQAVLPTYAAGVQEGDITPVVLYDQNGNTIGGNAPLEYAAVFSQSSTSAPAVNVCTNTTGATLVWTRTGVGQYLVTASSGVFALLKTISVISNGDTSPGEVGASVTAPTSIVVTSYDSTGTLADGVISDASILIKIYP